MPCDFIAPGVIVCSGPRGVHMRRMLNCPTCKRLRRFVIRHDGAWYGSTKACLTCLDEWCDGERMERPFKPRWKEERRAYWAPKWANALSRDEFNAAIDAEMAPYITPVDVSLPVGGAVT